jgi:hypothetical protein
MTNFAPITVTAIDDQGTVLFDYVVPFALGISARQALEVAFCLNQTAAKPDPFTFTLEYFGYSEAAQFPGFLGYEVESIGGFANSSTAYWELKVNGQVANTGADTTYPNPGGTVRWVFTPITPAPAAAPSPRAAVILARRRNRT